MKRISLFVLGALSFGALSAIAMEQSQWRWRLLLGAASGVVAGLATLLLVRIRRPTATRLRMRDDDPRFRWWYYVGGMILAGDFGALLAVQAVVPNMGARCIVAVSAGVIEAFAFMSLAKAVRATANRRSNSDAGSRDFVG